LNITENTNTTIAKSYDDYYYYQEDDSVSPFFECKALKTISLPDSLISIDNYAFFRSGLTAVHIPAGVTDIGDYAFAECRDLTSVTFATNNTDLSVGEYAFQHTALTAVEIPNSVTKVLFHLSHPSVTSLSKWTAELRGSDTELSRK
jgi:hypothetical protein